MKLQLQFIVCLSCLAFISAQNLTETKLNSSYETFIAKNYSKNKSVFNKLTNSTLKQKDLIFQLSKLGREISIKSNKTSSRLAKKPNKKQNKKQQQKIPISKGVYQIKSIYNNLKNGNSIYNDKSINTVRYIPSSKVDSTKKLYFLFNLSLISGSEQLIKSDLFINRKYIKQKLEFNLHYFLYSTQNNNNNKKNENATNKVNRDTSSASGSSATIYLKNLKNEKYFNQQTWQSFNIMNSIQSYLTTRKNRKLYENAVNKSNKNIYYTFNNLNNQVSDQPDELVLIMEATNFKSRKANKNLADLLNPYLMIYTNEKETNMKKFFQSKVTDSLIDKMSLNKPLDDELAQLKNFENQVDKQNESYDSNELNDYTTKSYQIALVNNNDTSNKIKLNSTFKLSSIESYLIEKSKLNDPYFNYIPQEQIKHVSKRDARKISPSFDDLYEEDDPTSIFEDSNKFGPNLASSSNENEIKKTCSKHSITIDFEDMSFSDWILEPKRYPSNYCSGQCKFPLNQVNF